MTKFLPTIFVDAMKQNPEAAVAMLDSEHENPELIWNEETRAKVARVVGEVGIAFQKFSSNGQSSSFQEASTRFQQQQSQPDLAWTLPEAFHLSLEDVSGEIVVSGVYLRLFVANPGWVLRKPKQFMEDLLERVVLLMGSGSSSQELELVTDSLVRLLEAQAALADQLPATGYINRVLSTMNTKGEASQKPPIMLLHQIAKSQVLGIDFTTHLTLMLTLQVCVESLANCDCVSPLHRAMKLRKDLLVVVCETFNRYLKRLVSKLSSRSGLR